MSSGQRVVIGVSLPALVAWLLSASASWWGSILPPHSDTQPHVPLVSVPVGTVTDVMSSVSGIFRVLLAVIVCLLFVEVGKVFAAKYGGPRLYALVLCYQLVLAFDTVRGQARDWWGWGLSNMGVVNLQTIGDWKENFIPVQSPWPSFLVLCILVLITVAVARSGSEEEP